MIVDALLDAGGRSGNLLGRSARFGESAVTALRDPVATIHNGRRRLSTSWSTLRYFLCREWFGDKFPNRINKYYQMGSSAENLWFAGHLGRGDSGARHAYFDRRHVGRARE